MRSPFVSKIPPIIKHFAIFSSRTDSLELGKKASNSIKKLPFELMRKKHQVDANLATIPQTSKAVDREDWKVHVCIHSIKF